MNNISVILILFLSLATGACDSESLKDDDSEPRQDSFQIGGFDPSKTQGDHFVINSARIVDQHLELSVSYSGGCERHIFSLYADEAVAQVFPPTISINAVHDANDDRCEAYITRTVSVEVTSLTDWLGDTFSAFIVAVDTNADAVRVEYGG